MSGLDAAPLSTWTLAIWAAKLFAVDCVGTGICIRARPGPQREAWLARLRILMGHRPLRKIPHSIADDRLLGGLDLAATLVSGRAIAERSVLADADGGAIILPSAERLSSAFAARIAAVHDSSEIHLERDGLQRMFAARFGIILIDEGVDAEETLPASLLDRIAFQIDLSAVSLNEIGGDDLALGDEIERAKERLPQVHAEDEAVGALCAATSALGIDSSRAPLLALRAAKAIAALDGRSNVSDADLTFAAQLVLAWRAQALPHEQAEEEHVNEPPDQEPSDESDTDHDAQGPDDRELDDIVLAAVRAALPPDLLAKLLAGQVSGKRLGLSGRAGALQKSGKRGRRAGVMRGDPRGGARFDLVATLRAAAPWQRIRRNAQATASSTQARPPHPDATRPSSPARGEGGSSCGENTPYETKRGGFNLLPLEIGTTCQSDMDLPSSLAGEGGERQSRSPGEGELTRTNLLRIQIRSNDFRIIRFAERRETLTIFAVDASGSLALNRLAEAKGAVELLLADCYIRRDQVALIAFRGRCADLLLPPTRSLIRANRCLSSLPGGGGTPLASGIDAAAALAQSALRRGQTPLIVMLTDGRANIGRDGQPGRPAAQADAMLSAKSLRTSPLKSLLIDTAPRPEPRAAELASAMGATYLTLPHMDANMISSAVKSAWTRSGALRHG